MPKFSLKDYRELLLFFKNVGFHSKAIDEFRTHFPFKTLFLRHDIDLHLENVIDMGNIENDLEIHSTFFIPITQPFNPFYTKNVKILRRLKDLGHSFGIHYDMENYPEDFLEQKKRLGMEIKMLESIIETPIKAITMHQPFKTNGDPFRELEEYIHPHDPRYQENTIYISDSCRAWRDESLLNLPLENDILRLHLTIHPESWLGDGSHHRLEHLEKTILQNAIRQTEEFILKEVKETWINYPGAIAHDYREKIE